METTFYHDNGGDDVKKLKSNMTLDFSNGGKKKNQKPFTPVLSSPDLNMLKLASPDLERLIIQQNGHVTTTPTPSSVVYPRCPTEEQEAYARGFVDALNELHQKKGGSEDETDLPATLSTARLISVVTTTSNENSAPFHPVSSTNSAPLTTTTSLPGGVIQFASQQSEPMETRSSDSPLYTISMQGNPSTLNIKEELPQTVPCIGAPMSPIDMENQERIKLERKRARNRVAARKCRTRKLERIGRLEDRVDELKGQNSQLLSTANSLRDQVCQLKKQIMQHVSSGCQVMTTQNLLS